MDGAAESLVVDYHSLVGSELNQDVLKFLEQLRESNLEDSPEKQGKVAPAEKQCCQESFLANLRAELKYLGMHA